MRERFHILFACLALLSWSAPVGALAVSEAELLSHLNQRLIARVELLAIASGEIDNLSVSVIQQRDVVGNQRMLGLRHEIKKDDHGYYIEITSREVVREPIIHFSLKLDWAAGRLTREYALLVDFN